MSSPGESGESESEYSGEEEDEYYGEEEGEEELAGEDSDDAALAESPGPEGEDGGEEEIDADDDDEDYEDLKDYRKGGYHPVTIGEPFSDGRYKILSKLGWGHFSTVWLAWDNQQERAITLKVQKSAQRYSEAARDEVKLLRSVSESERVEKRCLVLLTDHFVHKGLNGTHHVMAFEVLGPTLLSLIRQTDYQGLPIHVVRRVASCILLACAHLHEALSIIHTDLKPENILCEYSEAQMHSLIEEGRRYEAEHAAALKKDGGSPAAAVAAAEEDDDDDGEGDDEEGASAAASNGEGLSKNQKKRLKAKEKKKAEKAAANGNGGGEAAVDVSDAAAAADADAAPMNGNSSSSSSSGQRKDPRLKMQRTPAPSLNPHPDSPSGFMRFKVVDLGNSCWRDRHFTSDIQTRQYRCPEVIIGAGYDISADMWSVACVLFEAATGDLLFAPKAGQTWSRDEDHLALIMELVGRMPRKIALSGKYSKEFFSQKGELRNIKDLRFWSLQSVLQKKYELPSEVADPFAAFLLPMLDLEPRNRGTAKLLLHHPWLKDDDEHSKMLSELNETPPAAGIPAKWLQAATATDEPQPLADAMPEPAPLPPPGEVEAEEDEDGVAVDGAKGTKSPPPKQTRVKAEGNGNGGAAKASQQQPPPPPPPPPKLPPQPQHGPASSGFSFTTPSTTVAPATTASSYVELKGSGQSLGITAYYYY